MDWIWDAKKAAINKAKHGVSFETAILVFEDEFQISLLDHFPSEIRYITIGRPSIYSPIVLVVVHTWNKTGPGRIISAREASKKEKGIYRDDNLKN
ncbi:MAG: BrnT family toxin [Pseudomonadota bacterium]